MKKKKKKQIILFLILILLTLGIYYTMKCLNDPNKINTNKLKQLGYMDNEIAVLLNNDKYLKYALENEYEENLIKLINEKDFKIEFLDSYLKYIKDNKNAPIDETVYLVNNKYNYKYNSNLMKFINAKYFLRTRFNRYISYFNQNQTLSIDEIIKRVNSNVDYDFYTNIVDSDVSVGNLLICNKYYKLPKTYKGHLVTMNSAYTKRAGAQLDSTAYEAFKRLSDDARSKGLNIVNQSSYRSYSNQEAIYNNYFNEHGKEWTDKWSARPGHSEHQTGLALDVATYKTTSLDSFKDTKEFTWMQENAYKYGFILRYPDGQKYITGYGYEPWHYRYVGVEAATTIQKEKITYEEYYAYYVLKK